MPWKYIGGGFKISAADPFPCEDAFVDDRGDRVTIWSNIEGHSAIAKLAMSLDGEELRARQFSDLESIFALPGVKPRKPS